MTYFLLAINTFFVIITILLIAFLFRKSSENKDLINLILILNVVFLVILGISMMFGLLHNQFIEEYEAIPQYDENGLQMLNIIPISESPYYPITQGLGLLLFFGFPVLTITLSISYLLKNREKYGKSLMIPSSYVTVAYFTTLLGGYFFRTQGEGGMVFLYIWAQLIVTFTSVAVINLILFLMFQNQDNKS